MKMKSTLKKTAQTGFVFLFWILIWQIAAMIINREILLPSPVRVCLRLCELILTKNFWISSAMSIFRILSGFLLGITAGSIFAFFAVKVKIIKKLLSPVLTVTKATPVASFIIIALVWLGKQTVPVFASFLMVLPIIWENVNEGILNVDTSLSEVADIFKFTRWRRFRYLTVPSVIPYFLSGCKSGIGLAWKAGVAAEVLCTPAYSIGKMLFESKLYLESADLFAWTLTVIIMSVAIEIIIVRIISMFGKRYTIENGG